MKEELVLENDDCSFSENVWRYLGQDFSSPQEEQEQNIFSSSSSCCFEIGSCGVWSVSSSRPGCGIPQLRDGNPLTFWQTDGVGPHKICVRFLRVMVFYQISLLVHPKVDESYTPHTVSIRMEADNTCSTTMMEVQRERFVSKKEEQEQDDENNVEPADVEPPFLTEGEPYRNRQSGPSSSSTLGVEGGPEWFDIFLFRPTSSSSMKRRKGLEGRTIEIIILNNVQNGKDSHVRQLQIYGRERS